MHIGRLLRRRRIEAGYTFIALARETGVSPATLKAAEALGRVSPRTADRVAPILGLKSGDLKPQDNRGLWMKELNPKTGRPYGHWKRHLVPQQQLTPTTKQRRARP